MAFTCGFFNSVGGDRKYNSQQISQIFDGIITDGVFAHYGTHFNISPVNGSLSALIGTGRFWFDHVWGLSDGNTTVSFEAADPTQPRKDAIIIQINHNDEIRNAFLKVKKGTVGGNPPTMQKSDGITEYPLAYVTVPAGATSITASNIEVEVGTSDCPFATSVLESVNVDNLFDQWDAQFQEWFAGIQTVLDDDIATKLVNDVNNLKEQMTTVGLKTRPGDSIQTSIKNPETYFGGTWQEANSIVYPTANDKGTKNLIPMNVSGFKTSYFTGGTYIDSNRILISFDNKTKSYICDIRLINTGFEYRLSVNSVELPDRITNYANVCSTKNTSYAYVLNSDSNSTTHMLYRFNTSGNISFVDKRNISFSIDITIIGLKLINNNLIAFGMNKFNLYIYDITSGTTPLTKAIIPFYNQYNGTYSHTSSESASRIFIKDGYIYVAAMSIESATNRNDRNLYGIAKINANTFALVKNFTTDVMHSSHNSVGHGSSNVLIGLYEDELNAAFLHTNGSPTRLVTLKMNDMTPTLNNSVTSSSRIYGLDGKKLICSNHKNKYITSYISSFNSSTYTSDGDSKNSFELNNANILQFHNANSSNAAIVPYPYIIDSTIEYSDESWAHYSYNTWDIPHLTKIYCMGIDFTYNLLIPNIPFAQISPNNNRGTMLFNWDWDIKPNIFIALCNGNNYYYLLLYSPLCAILSEKQPVYVRQS